VELTQRTLKQNRYHAESDTLVFTHGEIASYAIQKKEWARYFAGDTPAPGLARGYISDPEELAALTSYFACGAWLPRPNVRARTIPTPTTSLRVRRREITRLPSTYLVERVEPDYVVGCLGAVLFWSGDSTIWAGTASVRPNMYDSPLLSWAITPSQRAAGLYFAVWSCSSCFRCWWRRPGALPGRAGSFLRNDISRFMPYNLLRTYHLQLAIFWIATAWVAAVSSWRLWWRRRAQRPASRRPVAAGRTDFLVLGSLAGEFSASTTNWGVSGFGWGTRARSIWTWGRFWQLLLAAKPCGWLC